MHVGFTNIVYPTWTSAKQHKGGKGTWDSVGSTMASAKFLWGMWKPPSIFVSSSNSHKFEWLFIECMPKNTSQVQTWSSDIVLEEPMFFDGHCAKPCRSDWNSKRITYCAATWGWCSQHIFFVSSPGMARPDVKRDEVMLKKCNCAIGWPPEPIFQCFPSILEQNLLTTAASTASAPENKAGCAGWGNHIIWWILGQAVRYLERRISTALLVRAFDRPGIYIYIYIIQYILFNVNVFFLVSKPANTCKNKSQTHKRCPEAEQIAARIE